MYWELTKDVYWGDRHAPAELAGKVKLILCVADQPDALESAIRAGPCPASGAAKPVLIRLALPDHATPGEPYFAYLRHVIRMAIDTGSFPLLVHCWAGQHRAPHVAFFIATAIGGYVHGVRERTWQRVLELRPDVQCMEFGRAVQDRLAAICRDQSNLMGGWFSHDGELGDIIYALPAIRACGGGALYLMASDVRHCRMRREHYEAIRPLLEIQPYLTSAKWWEAWQARDCPLNQFRRNLWPGRNLAQAHLTAVGRPHAEAERAWLTVDRIDRRASVVIGRCPRWRNPAFPWRRVWKKYAADAVFLGLRDEWEDFCRTVGADVRWVPTADLLEAARIIAGADLFVGNQSCLYAIAEGLKKPAALEVDLKSDNCRFRRSADQPAVVHGVDADLALPDV